MEIFAAFKALNIGTKIGILVGILGLLVAVIGSTAYVSYHKGLNVSKVAIAQYETKSAQLGQKQAAAQATVDVKTVTEYKDRVEYVDRVVYKTRDVIKYSVPEQFHLSEGWVYAYNQSVLGNEPQASYASDATASAVSDRAALDVAASNNGVCLANKAQLESLQAWFRDSETSRKTVNDQESKK